MVPSRIEDYFEPFVGAGCVYFKLAPARATISDKNAQLIRTYRAIGDDPDRVFALLQSVPLQKDAYLRLRALPVDQLSNAQAAARLIFLMKSCFNGVYRENKAGQFNTPWGGKVFKLPGASDLRLISDALKNTRVVHADFADALAPAGAGDFVYLDPPYPQTRHRGEFGGEFSAADLGRLLKECRRLDRAGAKVMLSYVDCDVLRDQLPAWNRRTLSAHRSVSSMTSFRGATAEVVLTNYKMQAG